MKRQVDSECMTLSSLTCLISQLTFHCFMLANLHVVTGRPEDMSIRIKRLYEIPRISSFLLPLNLRTAIKRLVLRDISKIKHITSCVCNTLKYMCCTWQYSSWCQTLEVTARPGWSASWHPSGKASLCSDGPPGYVLLAWNNHQRQIEQTQWVITVMWLWWLLANFSTLHVALEQTCLVLCFFA